MAVAPFNMKGHEVSNPANRVIMFDINVFLRNLF